MYIYTLNKALDKVIAEIETAKKEIILNYEQKVADDMDWEDELGRENRNKERTKETEGGKNLKRKRKVTEQKRKELILDTMENMGSRPGTKQKSWNKGHGSIEDVIRVYLPAKQDIDLAQFPLSFGVLKTIKT